MVGWFQVPIRRGPVIDFARIPTEKNGGGGQKVRLQSLERTIRKQAQLI